MLSSGSPPQIGWFLNEVWRISKHPCNDSPNSTCHLAPPQALLAQWDKPKGPALGTPQPDAELDGETLQELAALPGELGETSPAEAAGAAVKVRKLLKNFGLEMVLGEEFTFNDEQTLQRQIPMGPKKHNLYPDQLKWFQWAPSRSRDAGLHPDGEFYPPTNTASAAVRPGKIIIEACNSFEDICRLTDVEFLAAHNAFSAPARKFHERLMEEDWGEGWSLVEWGPGPGWDE